MSAVGEAFQIGMGLAGVGATWYGLHIARRGRQRDLKQKEKQDQNTEKVEARRQQFTELEASLASARSDLAYHENQTRIARERQLTAEQERDQAAANSIRRLQEIARRCLELSRRVRTALDNSPDMPADQRRRLEVAIRDVENHLEQDHDLIFDD